MFSFPLFYVLIEHCKDTSFIHKVCYGILEENYKKKSSDSVQSSTHVFLQCLELRGCHARDLLELARQISDTRVIEFISYFGERQLVVKNQLLDAFNALQNEITLNGDTCKLTKELAQTAIFTVQLLRQIVGEVELGAVVMIMNQIDNESLDAVDGLLPFIVK